MILVYRNLSLDQCQTDCDYRSKERVRHLYFACRGFSGGGGRVSRDATDDGVSSDQAIEQNGEISGLFGVPF